MSLESGLLALGLGLLFGRQGYGERGATRAPSPPPKPLPPTPTAVPWPNAAPPQLDAPDVAPAGTPQQKKDWAKVKAAEYEYRKRQEAWLEDQARAQAQADHKVP